MNRDSKTPAALIALARTRRMQRAMAHAYLHRNEPIPTLRGTLHFVTDTTCVTDDVAPARGHQMRVLGVAMAERVAYVVEDLGDADEAPIVYRLWLDGPRAGHLVPIHAWYEQCDDPAEIRARIAAIEPTLEPLMHATTELWMLSTRVVQHRALRVASARESIIPGPASLATIIPGPASLATIRKFALQLKVEPVARGPSGHATVTAFMRPNATLSDVWMLTSGDAIARITYTGIPSGVGLTKDTMVLLTG